MAGIVVVNRNALSTDEMGELHQLFAGHRIVKCDPTEVGQIVRDALAKAVEFVAVAGGDGTMRAAAHELRHHQVPLLPVPAGTRNHFAKEMGITTFEEAAAAITSRPRRVDLGDVNGWSFMPATPKLWAPE